MGENAQVAEIINLLKRYRDECFMNPIETWEWITINNCIDLITKEIWKENGEHQGI